MMRRRFSADLLGKIAYEAMIERDFKPAFSKEILAELKKIKGPAHPSPSESIRDLRNFFWISIDNEDSLDLDQITYAAPPTETGGKIYVAIADVDALVKKGSAIDGRASYNTTTVYAPTSIFPMLPDPLCTNLTSLKEDEERLAIVVEMSLNPEGTVKSYEIYRALVINHAKLNYPAVSDWITHPTKAPKNKEIREQIQWHDAWAQKMKAERHRRGSLSLETLEVEPVIKNNRVVELRARQKLRANEIIEEFMIAANESITAYFESEGIPSFRRIVRIPKRWDRLVIVAKEHHGELPPEPDAKALESFLVRQRQRDPETFPDLSLTIVKLLGRGEYVVQFAGSPPIGHFALALQNYTHATAPNRRFPDLIAQRLLKEHWARKGNLPYSPDELTGYALRCTEKETDADKVVRKVKKAAAAFLLAPQIGSSFEAIVTGAGNQGTWVRLYNPPVEGKLIEGYVGLDVGDRVKVRLMNVDPKRGFIDFARS